MPHSYRWLESYSPGPPLARAPGGDELGRGTVEPKPARPLAAWTFFERAERAVSGSCLPKCVLAFSLPIAYWPGSQKDWFRAEVVTCRLEWHPKPELPDFAELLKFGSTVKKKEDKNYGAFGPKAGLIGKKATKIVFD